MPAVAGWIVSAIFGQSVAGILRGIGGLLLRKLAIKATILGVLAAVWAYILSFAKDCLLWFLDTTFWVLAEAMEALEFPDIFLMMMQTIEGWPEGVVQFAVAVGVFTGIQFLLKCLFANRALRMIPIIGNAFRT